MRIVIVGPFPPYRGGIAHFNERLAQQLHDEGHTIFAVNFSFQYPQFLFPGKSQTEEQHRELPYKHRRIVHSLNPLSWFRAAHDINKFQPDLVIFRFWLPLMAPALGTIAGKIKKDIFKVAIMDNVVPHEKRPGDKQLTGYFIKRINGFVSLSKSVAKELEDFDTSKPKVTLFHPIYDQFGQPVDKQQARDHLGISRDERLILFFGFIRGYKGLDILLNAMADENLKKLNVKLLVGGEFYDESEPYHQIIKEKNTEDRVILHDHFIPSNEVRNYFCAADCVVQPYKTATQSGVTQIAYHFERPMIVTNVSGLPELVPHGSCGYVVPPDPESLAQAINMFYDHNKEEIFSKNAAERKKEYSWQSFSRKLREWVEKNR